MSATDTLDRYFQALRQHDWATLGDCVTPNVHRVGPYDDVIDGREAYVAFLSGIVPRLPNYELQVRDVTRADDGSAWVRLSELLDVDGARREHPEALRFEFASDGRIATVDIYLKRDSP